MSSKIKKSPVKSQNSCVENSVGNNTIKKTVRFNKYEKQIQIPFIVYAHFEALRIPSEKSFRKNSKEVFTHEPCGFGYSIKCSYDDSLSKYEHFCGKNSTEIFWKKLKQDANFIADKLKIKMEAKTLNKKQINDFKEAMFCYFCHQEFSTQNDKFEDFCQLTGDYLGASHKKCKSTKKIPYFIPVVMHNFSKWGAHFILKGLSNEEAKQMFYLVEKGETFFSFTKYLDNIQLRFIDSNRFLDSKLEDMEKILGDSRKKRIRKEFKQRQEFDVMKIKGWFPHYYIDSFEKFRDRNLPGIEGFYDQLHDTHISKIDYRRAIKVWTIFNCKTLGDYFLFYLKSNVLLLEDIFENFRMLCLEKYQLDPAYYYTAAGLGWDAMLKYINSEIELLQDQEMIDFFKCNIRGGLVQCSKRFAKANHVYCKNYDDKNPSSFIMYLDANNLAGWAMSQNLPHSEFSWLSETEIKNLEKTIRKIKENSKYGYILEVDLNYPQKLHKSHNDLPFCCERIISPSANSSSKYSNEKPILNLNNKTRYVMHYRNLQQCLENKLELKKIHRVLKFRQCKWMEPYISYNTKLRSEAKNDFEIKLYKLLNNAVSGKTMQKISNDKPIYAGFTLLELSKKFMYDFHYKTMVPKYKNKINLLYMDTDSLIYEIQTDDFFQDLKNDPEFLQLFDTSNIDSKWEIPPINKKVLGKMKDECSGKIIYEFYGVGAKVYCLDVEGEQIKKAVGVKKYVKEKHITKFDYKNCIFNDEKIVRNILTTESRNHILVTVEGSKTALSPGDTKRYVLPDKINTLAWGYQEKRVKSRETSK